MIEKIITCPSCKGTGKQELKECTNFHHNEYDVWDEHCGCCDGTGRMVEQTITRKLRPDELTLRKRTEEDIVPNISVDMKQKVMAIYWNGKIPSVNAKNQRMVNAIKTLREQTGIGLAECKNLICEWRDEDIADSI
jgi:hypothetical protein